MPNERDQDPQRRLLEVMRFLQLTKEELDQELRAELQRNPALTMEPCSIADCTAAIIAGGKSLRMGKDKAFLQIEGVPLIERQAILLHGLFGAVLISANDPPKFAHLGLPTFADRLPGGAPLLGIHAALLESPTPWLFACACDMPFLDEGFLSHLASLREGVDAVVPWFEGFPEPLHAFYRVSCAPAIEAQWKTGDLKIARFLDRVKVARFEVEDSPWRDRAARSLVNVNTPEDLARHLPPQQS